MGSIGEPTENGTSVEYDVLCIGAGLSGVYTTYRLRELGLHGKILEAGSAEGGTWFWNRYPGARFDSESYSYQYFFDKDLMNEWHWQEHFAGQPEILAYINHVVEKYDLRKDMQFDTRIERARFDNDHRIWRLTDRNGNDYTCRWLITAIGILTNPTLPNIPGVSDYKGEACHTARWPQAPVKFENKRVAVIGTGATGIQVIQEVAKTAGHLTVFQRTPNWACPMYNGKIDAEEMERLRTWYPDMIKHCNDAYLGFLHEADPRTTKDVTLEERDARWEELYNSRGFGIWFSNFADVGVDREANRQCSEFLANKIRQRVKDSATAEKLVPKHGFATRRVPLETNYFEVYNQDNVELIDLNTTAIERITEKGIRTTEEDMEFDMIVYATGFDAVTGSYDAIDIRGLDNTSLRELWNGGPKTYLGFTVEKFPNMFMIMGPHQAYGNNPRSIEYATFWITEAIRYFEDNGISYVEATKDGVEEWTKHVLDCAAGALMDEVDSWMTGINKNVGKTTRFVARYSGSNQQFRQGCDEVRENRYNTFKLE